jgi:type II secretory pathway pseudopilin PulG
MENPKDMTWGLALIAGALIATVVAAIVVPNFLNALNRGKQKRAMSDLREIGIAMDEYYENYKSYPVGTSTRLSGIQAEFARAHIYNLPLQDRWGGDFLYYSDGNSSYTIISTGKDHKLDGPNIYPSLIVEFNNDIVFSNGSFVTLPEGMCQ